MVRARVGSRVPAEPRPCAARGARARSRRRRVGPRFTIATSPPSPEHLGGKVCDRVDLQARAAADQQVARGELGVRLAECGRQELPEEDDGGLQVRAAGRAGGDGERRRRAGPRRPRSGPRKPQARHSTSASVPWSSSSSRLPGRAVEPVDVLGQHAPNEAEALELGDREVAGDSAAPVRGARDALAVEPPELLRLAPPRFDVGELLEAPRPPETVAAAVVGEAALGRDAGAREDERMASIAEQLGEEVESRSSSHRSAMRGTLASHS